MCLSDWTWHDECPSGVTLQNVQWLRSPWLSVPFLLPPTTAASFYLFCSTYSERFVFRMGEIGVRGASARAQHNDVILGKWTWTTRSCYPPKSHTMYTRSPTGPKVNNPTFILDLLPKKFLFIHCFTVDNRPTTSKCILRFDVPFVSSVSFSGFHLLFIADFER